MLHVSKESEPFGEELFESVTNLIKKDFQFDYSQEKIHTHVNASLTAVSLAKAAHHLALPEEERKSFSLSSIKVKYFNQDYLNRIFMEFGINPESQINSERYRILYEYGCIAA